jgi:uncharacterized membrane protein
MNAIIVIVLIMYAIFFAFGFISYAFNSYGLYEIAKRKEEKNALIAWIPYINKYILGKVSFKSSIHGILLVFLNIIEIISLCILLFVRSIKVVNNISIAILVLSIITSVYTYVAHYKLYRKYSKSTILMTVLDILSFGILGPFFIFAIRNNEENN